MKLTIRLVPGLGTTLAAFVLAAPAWAADVAKEITTASTHAGLAAKGTDLKVVQMHLHHVVNCLVGPDGQGFDKTQINPCKEFGAEIMVDFKGDAAQRQTLQKALDTSLAGLKQDKTEAAQHDAEEVHAMLDTVK